MKNILLLFFTVLLFVFVLYILNIKGYMTITNFTVNNRRDIEQFLINNYSDSSFITTNPNTIKQSILYNFNDVDAVSIDRNIDFSYTITVSNKKVFGKISDGVYLSESGKVFYSSLEDYTKVPQVYIKNFDLKTTYLTDGEVEFVKKLFGYPNFTIYILTTNNFEVTGENFTIQVPTKFENIDKMVGFANYQIKNSNNNNIDLIVLKDKIVLKNPK